LPNSNNESPLKNSYYGLEDRNSKRRGGGSNVNNVMNKIQRDRNINLL